MPSCSSRRSGSLTESPIQRTPRCSACGHPSRVVWVHGHGQCATCGTNIEPCCDGAPCPTSLRPASTEVED